MHRPPALVALLVASCAAAPAPRPCPPPPTAAPAPEAPRVEEARFASLLPRFDVGPGPLSVSFVHPEGAWIGLCQEPPGEGRGPLMGFGYHGESPADAAARVVYGSGEELAVDGLVAVGPRGRWLVVVQEGAFVLVDTESRRTTPLRPVRGEDDPGAYTVDSDHPPLSIDGEGRVLASMRWGESPSDAVAVVRDLETGEESVLSAPPGQRILGARVDRGGRWLWVWTWPSQLIGRRNRRSGGSGRACARPWTPWDGREGLPAPARDTLRRFAVPLADRPPLLSSPTFVEEASVGLGERVVVRDDAGGLALLDREGARVPLVEAACDPFGLHTARDASSLAVVCRSNGEVRIYDGSSPGRSVTWTFEEPFAVGGDDEWEVGRWIDAGSGSVLDLERSHRFAVAEAATILAEHGGRLLVRGPGECGLTLVDDAGSRPLEHETCGFFVAQAGPLVLLDGGVVDLLSGRQGLLSGHPWAIHESGAALVTTEDRPLLWERVHFLERPCPCAGE